MASLAIPSSGVSSGSILWGALNSEHRPINTRRVSALHPTTVLLFDWLFSQHPVQGRAETSYSYREDWSCFWLPAQDTWSHFSSQDLVHKSTSLYNPPLSTTIAFIRLCHKSLVGGTMSWNPKTTISVHLGCLPATTLYKLVLIQISTTLNWLCQVFHSLCPFSNPSMVSCHLPWLCVECGHLFCLMMAFRESWNIFFPLEVQHQSKLFLAGCRRVGCSRVIIGEC